MARNMITGIETQKMQEYTQEQIDRAEHMGLAIPADVKEQIFEYANLIGEEEKVRTLVRNLTDAINRADEDRVEELLDDAKMNIQDLPDPTIGKLELRDYGYIAEDMVPLRKEAALDYHRMGSKIYCLGRDGGKGEYQVQFQRFDTIKKKHWSATTVAAIVRDEIYIGTRIWGKTRCSMHTAHKAVLNDETEWVRLENHHTAIIDRALFEKANEMHPKKRRIVAESRTNFTLERRKKQPALLICANCGHSLLKETEHLLKCSDARTNGDPVCRSLVIRREPLEENILELVHQYAASLLEKEKKTSSKSQCEYKEINTAELQKQSRQLTSEKMKLYDDYKDGRMDRDLYKQRAEKISGQLDEIKRKIEDAENSKKLLEQNELPDKIKLKDFLGIQKFDTEKLREIIKVIRVHSQDEIEIEWNFDDIFSEQR